jgi:hypothetical protein
MILQRRHGTAVGPLIANMWDRTVLLVLYGATGQTLRRDCILMFT